MPDPHELRRLQGWLREVITHPDGVAAGAASHAARAELAVPPLELELVVRPSARLSAAQRLDLYHRSYHLRLLEAVRVMYPALRHLLGDDLFDDFALDYLHARPSHSYTLRRLGEGFPDHLAHTRPDGGAVRETWPDLMIDLAVLERTVAEVYDAPGAEGERLPTAEVLPPAPDSRWLCATVEPVGCLRLVCSSFAAGPYLSAVWRGEDPAVPPPAESFVAVSRRDYVVKLLALDAPEHELLDSLVRGAQIEAAALTAGLAPAHAWRLVRRWTDHGFFGSVHAGIPVRWPVSPAA